MTTPPAKNKEEPKQRKKAEAIVSEIACEIALAKAARKAARQANKRREKALWKATSDLQFCGDIIIEQSREDAIATAKEVSSKSNANGHHMAFFVDGSMFMEPKKKSKSSISGSKSSLVTLCGAAVIYKSSEDSQDWHERHISLLHERNSDQAELSAVAEGLADATTKMMHFKSKNRVEFEKIASNYKVIIFTDSQRALTMVDKLRGEKFVAEDQVRSHPIIRKIITRSQYLHRIGIHLELRWVPGHSGVEGNDRADAAAQRAAKAQDISICIDEGLRLIEVEAASKTTNKQPPSTKRQQREKPVIEKKGGVVTQATR